ncbi:MAG: DUF4908 domain-containing protein, partial [Pseudomonadota bacterium]
HTYFRRWNHQPIRWLLASVIASVAFIVTMQNADAQNLLGKKHDPFDALRGAYVGEALTERTPEAADVSASWFETDKADIRFLFDQSGPDPLLRFAHDPEVFVLTPTPGPRGDTIYKLDDGAAVLRLTSLGGVTVYAPPRADGEAAFFAGDGPALVLPHFTARQIEDHAVQNAAEAGAAIGTSIAFEAPTDPTWFKYTSNAVLADAIDVTSRSLIKMANEEIAAYLLREKLKRVVFLQGDARRLQWDGQTITVTYNRNAGPAGRPSSSEILLFLEQTL